MLLDQEQLLQDQNLGLVIQEVSKILEASQDLLILEVTNLQEANQDLLALEALNLQDLILEVVLMAEDFLEAEEVEEEVNTIFK